MSFFIPEWAVFSVVVLLAIIGITLMVTGLLVIISIIKS